MVKLHRPHQDTGSLSSYHLGVSARILITLSALVPQGKSLDLCSCSLIPWLFLYHVQEMYWAQMFFLHLDWVICSRPARTGPAFIARSITPQYLHAALWGSAPFDRFAFTVRRWEPTLTTYSEVSICVSWKHKASSSSILSLLLLEKLDIW